MLLPVYTELDGSILVRLSPILKCASTTALYIHSLVVEHVLGMQKVQVSIPGIFSERFLLEVTSKLCKKILT